MPATEQPWRNQKLLHKVFAISGLVLLGSTIWMLAADHFRPWKPYQRKFEAMETRLNRWEQDRVLSDQHQKQLKEFENELALARSKPVDKNLIEKFKQAIKKDAQSRNTELSDGQWPLSDIDQRVAALDQAVEEGDEESQNNKDDPDASEKPAGEKPVGNPRAIEEGAELFGLLEEVIREARFREDNLLSERKFVGANRDAAKGALGILVRDNRPKSAIEAKQTEVDELQKSFNDLTDQYDQASAYRKELQAITAELQREESAIQAKIDEHQDELRKLEASFEDLRNTYFTSGFPWLGKKVLELPIVEAFNSPRQIDNLWSEGVEIDYNFQKVRRFDRCTTCHQGMDKVAGPDAPTKPKYHRRREVTLVVQGEKPQPSQDAGDSLSPIDPPDPYKELLNSYGLQIAEEGLLEAGEVTIKYVRRYSPAARAQVQSANGNPSEKTGQQIREGLLHAQSSFDVAAQAEQFTAGGLMQGDVIAQVENDMVTNRAQAARFLLDRAGKPVKIKVLRGVPQPYSSHPRLDLFITSLSPHPMPEYGCTICHEGQGSATDFKWASHTPNDYRDDESNRNQRAEWIRNYGWFDNPHWIFPMYPKRFLESSCLKCHHDVVDLAPSEKFPDPPAPKVVYGYNLIRRYGCFGCHEINGYDGDRRIGPDLRLEPNYFAHALNLQQALPQIQKDLQQKYQEFEKENVDNGSPDWSRQDWDKLSSLEVERLALQNAAGGGTLSPQEQQENQQRMQQIGQELDTLRQKIGEETIESLREQIARFKLKMQLLEDLKKVSGEIVADPTDEQPRHVAIRLLEKDQQQPKPEDRVLSEQTYELIDAFKDAEHPGQFRKVGPSLRYAASKLDPQFLSDWINNPRDFRPTTRMPKFFGLWEHLTKNSKGMQDSVMFEPLEVLGMATYIREKSQPYQLDENAPDLPAQPDKQAIARGKRLFETRGCLACHNHKDFPGIEPFRPSDEVVQGPDLSRIGDKFDPQRNPNGHKWLYSWIKNPTQYSPRTLMPDLLLEPYKDKSGATIDPIADIVAFLMASKQDWRPKQFDQDLQHLDELAIANLKEAFSTDRAQQYFDEGIPPEFASELKGAEIEMVADLSVPVDQRNLEKKRLLYIGRKSIAKYGCYACHDIPGFEDAKPIGTSLADWGRKDPTKLAFEHIMHHVHGNGHHGDNGDHEHSGHKHADDEKGAKETDPDPLPKFYDQALASSHRTGFIYQKLRQPRSFDYHTTENKTYNERLRMPHFAFNQQQREAIITFVLGLVAEPPVEEYVYQPTPRQEAIVEGRKVLDKFNCAGCHVLELEKWQVNYDPAIFETPEPFNPQKTFPFAAPRFTAEQLRKARELDRRGRASAELVGMPRLSEDGLPMVVTADGVPLTSGDSYNPHRVEYQFQLWKPTAVAEEVQSADQTKVVGSKILPAKANIQYYPRNVERDARYPAEGGVLTKYLLPKVVAYELEAGTEAGKKGSEAWGWLPPPLHHEGEKVRPSWLHQFLLHPTQIRPAVVMRMPKFNMSPDDAEKLVRYFAAMNNTNYPHQHDSQTAGDYLQLAEKGFRDAKGQKPASPTPRLDAALRGIVMDTKNYCAQCHQVGDFTPQKDPRGAGPNLAQVFDRLRPDYLRKWIALPAGQLPYTGMPTVITYDMHAPNEGGVPQEVFPGSSIDQLNGVVDLLSNMDVYALEHARFSQYAKQPPANTNTPPTGGGGE